MDQLRSPLYIPSASVDMPEPIFLADLVKLFYGPWFINRDRSIGDQGWVQQVQVELASKWSKFDIKRLIQQSFHMSSIVWPNALGGDLREFTSKRYTSSFQSPRSTGHSSGTDTRFSAEFINAVQALWTTLAESRGSDLGAETALQTIGFEAILHLAALINCGLGASAFEWSKSSLTPVIVKFNGQSFIGLVPNLVFHESRYLFFLVEVDRYRATQRTTRRFSLIAWNPKGLPESYTVCLFPPDIDRLGIRS